MALGAGRDSVLTMVIRQGLSLVAIGLAVGVAGALMAGRVLNVVSLSNGSARPVHLRRCRRPVYPVRHHRVLDPGPACDDGRSVDRPAG